MIQKPPRARKCKECPTYFVPLRPMQKVCGPGCAIKAADRRKSKLQKVERKETREKLLELKPLQYWLKRAEKAVNAFVLQRDREQSCISCGCNDAEQWHAGHFISVGASSATRYDPANIHKQCRQDNFFGHATQADYEARLRARIGDAEVDRLKMAKRERKWTREECQAIETEYRQKLRELLQRP